LSAIPRRLEFLDQNFSNVYPVHDTSANVRSRLVTPAKFGTIQDFSALFEWELLQNAQSYDLTIGTQGPGSDNIRSSQAVVDNSLSVDTIPGSGDDIFARLWTESETGWRYHDYLFFGYDQFESASQLRSPKPGSILESERIEFVWDKPAEATRFDLIVGNQGPGSNNIRTSQPIDTTRLTLDDVPIGGGDINVRLLSKSDAWYYRDYTFKGANNTGRAFLQSPSPGSTLSPGALTVEWDRTLGATAYDLLVGSNGPGTTNIRSTNVTLHADVDRSRRLGIQGL